MALLQVCSALHDFSRKWSAQAALFQAAFGHASALCRLLCASALSKLLCARALRQLLRASALRMCSVQVGLCKLLCASALCKCSVRFAERKLLCASDSAQVALRKCCRSCGNVLRVLFLYLKVAIFQPELRERAPRTTLYLKVATFQPREHAPHTTSVLKSCDFPAGAAGARSAYYVCTYKLRFSSRSCRARTRRESNPRPRDCESRRASHETTSKGHFASNKVARRHSENASTRTIPAEIVKVLSF